MSKIEAAADGLRQFGDILREWKTEAFAADPLLGPALAEAQKRDPDIGWLDIAAALEKARERVSS